MRRDLIHSAWSSRRAVGARIRAIVCTAVLATVLSPLAGADAFAGSYSAVSENGHYRVTLQPVPDVVPLAELHHWIVQLETRDGNEFAATRLGIKGGMPSHGHGLASEPRVTEFLGDGKYLIEGMKFHMGGDWRLVVGLSGPAGFDRAVFDVSLSAGAARGDSSTTQWTEAEIALLGTFSRERLALRKDPSNRFSGDERAAEFGRKLFFDAGLSASRKIACATCHEPARKFTDGKKKSFGTRETARHSPSLIGVAQGRWFYWDGRRDSLWAQAITPLETPGEMDNTRVNVVRYVMTKYGASYEELTGERIETSDERHPPDAGPYADSEGKERWHAMQRSDRDAINRSFANVGKFLAAYIETLQPGRSRFDEFVLALADGEADRASQFLDATEQAGLKLFLDGSRTQCIRCHNGPLFTNHGFHNIATGVADDGSQDFGRMIGLQAALLDEFNCRGRYSDLPADECAELRFADTGHASPGAFKVPSLRNVALTAPYMHDGRFATLVDVLDFYTQTPDESAGPHELPALELSSDEIDQLAAFLASLSDETGD